MKKDIARNLRGELDAVLARLRTLGLEGAETRSIPGQSASDLFDSAQLVEQRELGQISAGRLANRARRLSVALARLQSGEYGTCAICSAPIGRRRLEAIPDVQTCITCQEQCERLDLMTRPR
jgi:DnaK suppressor protein